MIARAPGKLFVTGAYAVLEGAPALVLAIDRHAFARSAETSNPPPEVAAVARKLDMPAPAIDVRALCEGDRKLGLGSSAAAVVAATACLLAEREAKHGRTFDPSSAEARAQIVELARAAHREVQPLGSGGDVAASTHGGAIVVQLCNDDLRIETTKLPAEFHFRAFALGAPLRTSSVLERLARQREEVGVVRARAALVEAADMGASAVRDGSAMRLVEAATRHVEALSALGIALDQPLVPAEIARAHEVLGSRSMNGTTSDFTLLPSGAGGGDTVLWLGARAPTDQETSALAGIGLTPLSLALDTRGVSLVPLAGK